MNQVKIYPFSDVLCPQWALGATSCQCHIHIAVRCTMCPHWAPGATRPQCPLHLAISDVLGPLWAIGATIWTTPRSIHFQTFHVPNEPWEPLISMSYTYSCSMHYVSPLSPGSHQASTSFTFSWLRRSRSCTSSRSMHYVPHWALGATRLQHLLHLANSDVLVPLWAMGATIWIKSKSIHFQTFHVPNEPLEPLHVNVIYI